MEEKQSLVSTIRALSNAKYNIRFLEASVTSTQPLVFRATTDNALIIGDNSLLPLSAERFSTVTKKALIYQISKDEDEEPQEVEIEIDNDIKVEDLFLLIEFDNGETCKYLVFDKI